VTQLNGDQRSKGSDPRRLIQVGWDRIATSTWGPAPTDGARLAPGMAPEACSVNSNYFSELEIRYGIEP